MKKALALLLIIMFFTDYHAQSDSTIYNKWIPSLATTLNFSQISFTNWEKGGENSLAWSLEGLFTIKFIAPYWHIRNELKTVYGQSKISGENFKVTENEVYMESLLSYRIDWKVDPYISNTIRTQVTAGYSYTDTGKTEIANFFDPAYLTQTLGFTFDRLKYFQTRLGIGIEEIITTNFHKYSDDTKTPDKVETFKLETGIESISDLKLKIDKNLLLKSKLRLFSAFDRLDIWDIRWDTDFTAKVNNWLNVKLTFLLVYQRDQSAKTQIKQSLQLGITYIIF